VAKQGQRGRDREERASGEGILEDIVIPGGINRCAKVIKGGRRFSFSAVVVVGDRAGRVGYGFGKANEVPNAVEKAKKAAIRNLTPIPVVNGTIPHTVIGRFGASKVLLRPATPGTGVIAGTTVRALVELAGVKNILTKSFGSNNPVNLVKATFDALTSLRSRADVERIRGVKLDVFATTEVVEIAQAVQAVPVVTAVPVVPATPPSSEVKQ
jgi:small subunit ribosomal protein S5